MSPNNTDESASEKPWWEDNFSSSPEDSNFVPIHRTEWRDEQAPTTESMSITIPIQEVTDAVDDENTEETEGSNDDEDDELYADASYYSRPHITQFVNSVVVNAAIFLVSLDLCVWLSITHSQQALTYVGLFGLVTLINLYVVKRSHIKWSGTYYIVTGEFVIIQQSDSIIFLIFRDKERSVRKSTLVGQMRKKRTFTEHVFFRSRGTAVLTTQDAGKPPIEIRYIRYIDDFMRALKK